MTSTLTHITQSLTIQIDYEYDGDCIGYSVTINGKSRWWKSWRRTVERLIWKDIKEYAEDWEESKLEFELNHL